MAPDTTRSTGSRPRGAGRSAVTPDAHPVPANAEEALDAGGERVVLGDQELVRMPDDIQVHQPMSARTKARKRALDVLFAAEANRTDPLAVLDQAVQLVHEGEPAVRPFTIDLVRGVVDHRQEIDQRLADAGTDRWPLHRMAAVDRALARIACYELLFTDVAPEAVISEAVQLADEFSTDDSAAFLNGLLAALVGGSPQS